MKRQLNLILTFVLFGIVKDERIRVPEEPYIYFAEQTQASLVTSCTPSSGWQSVHWDIGVDPTVLCNDTAPWAGVARNYSNPAYSDVIARTVSAG